MAVHIGILPADVLDSISVKMAEPSSMPSTSFLRLPHPRTGIPSLFLPYQLSQDHQSRNKWGILEAQSVAPPNPRSWFFIEGEVAADGKMLLMTPIDPSFLLLPILRALMPSKDTAVKFLPLEDVFEEAVAKSAQLYDSSNPTNPSSSISPPDIIALTKLDCVANAMRRICDVKDITPEITVYRYSEDRTMSYLRSKVARLSTEGVSEKSRTLIRSLAKDGLMEDGREDLLELGRTKAACNLISQYLPHDVYLSLLANYDFSPLDTYLKKVQDEATAMALANAPAVKAKTSKTANGVDEEGKKRKAKAKTSQGVEKLKKVNVTGMAKMTSFFQKK
ncbi:hypothetical protein BV25DRAFT_1884461 [Artomyces pyxidatus]|uniref:Uncharacterized protein n=1 Tax=Artomyces pyxidatus TaxID=48021 RepID=A0ACB8T251_9AGAM|nr:hypothetical protein BV25DRAFT_1884461 [Artomyces pyxidatus]